MSRRNTTAIALKTAYDGKYGAPSAGAPKVFVKYFYVNTATGEKSGEMLGVATLASDLYTVSKLLGHCNIRTTQIYAKIVDENKRNAVNLVPKI